MADANDARIGDIVVTRSNRSHRARPVTAVFSWRENYCVSLKSKRHVGARVAIPTAACGGFVNDCILANFRFVASYAGFVL